MRLDQLLNISGNDCVAVEKPIMALLQGLMLWLLRHGRQRTMPGLNRRSHILSPLICADFSLKVQVRLMESGHLVQKLADRGLGFLGGIRPLRCAESQTS